MSFLSSAVQRPRPLGIALLTLWSLVVGVALTVLAMYAVYGIRRIPAVLAAFQSAPDALVGLAVATSVAYVVMAYGLWTLRPWGRWLAIAFAIVGLVFGFFTLPIGFLGVAVSLGSVWYLTSYQTRALFRPPDTP